MFGVAAITPQTTSHLFKYAEALIVTNRFSEAVDVLREIIAREPSNIEALMLLGRAYAGMRNFEEALQIFTRVNMANTNYVPAIYERANVLLTQWNFGGARQLYERTLQIDPEFALGHLGLARLARVQRNLAEYQSRLQQAIAIDPNNREILAEMQRAVAGQQ